MRVLRVPPHAMCFHSIHPARRNGRDARDEAQRARIASPVAVCLVPVVLLVLKYWRRADFGQERTRKRQASHHQRFVGGPTTRLRTWQIRGRSQHAGCRRVILRLRNPENHVVCSLRLFSVARLCRLGVMWTKEDAFLESPSQILVSGAWSSTGTFFVVPAFSSSISDLCCYHFTRYFCPVRFFQSTRAAKFTMVPKASSSSICTEPT